MVIELIQLPETAARNGVAVSGSWPSHTIGVCFAILVAAAFAFGSWRAAATRPLVAALAPAEVAASVLLGRLIAASGGPDELYLVGDRKLWLAYVAVFTALSLGLAAYCAMAARRPGGATLEETR